MYPLWDIFVGTTLIVSVATVFFIISDLKGKSIKVKGESLFVGVITGFVVLVLFQGMFIKFPEHYDLFLNHFGKLATSLSGTWLITRPWKEVFSIKAALASSLIFPLLDMYISLYAAYRYVIWKF